MCISTSWPINRIPKHKALVNKFNCLWYFAKSNTCIQILYGFYDAIFDQAKKWSTLWQFLSIIYCFTVLRLYSPKFHVFSNPSPANVRALLHADKSREHSSQVQKRYTAIRAGSGQSGYAYLEWKEQRGAGVAGDTVKEAWKRPLFFSFNTGF